MSESPRKPEQKDRTALYVAIVGATATIIAALIGIVPLYLNRNSPPPTPTPAPTTVLATLTPNATTNTLVVVNQFERVQDFVLDGSLLGTIETGKYKSFEIPPGPHEFKNCSVPTDPAVTPECSSKQVNATSDPYPWDIYGNAPLRGNATLLVLNPNSTDRDFFLDDVPKGTVRAHSFVVIDTPPGKYVVRTCTPGSPPTRRGR